MKAADSTAESGESVALSETKTDRLVEMAKKDFGYMREKLQMEHKDVVVDMVSRSFADKGDLTTLANVTYENLYQQVSIAFHMYEFVLSSIETVLPD